MATFSDFEEAKAYIESKGALSLSRRMAWRWERCRRCETVEQAVEAARDMLWTINSVTQGRGIEEFLDGEEFSLFAFVNGDKFYIMPTAQDQKRTYDGDKGLTLVVWGLMRQFHTLPQSVVDFGG